MPATLAPEWVFDVGADNRDGFLASFSDETSGGLPGFFRNDSLWRRIRPVQRSLDPSRPWDDVAESTDTWELGIGVRDAQPTSGTWSFVFNTVQTSGLAYNITAAALQTAMNANAAITAVGGVTVAKVGNVFEITFVSTGDQTAIAWTTTALYPPTAAISATKTNGLVGVTNEVQSVRLAQRPYAYSGVGSWTFTAGTAAITCSVLSAGTSSARQVWKLAIAPEPYTGAVRLSYPCPEITTVGCIANTARAQVEHIGCAADSSNSLRSTYLDISDDAGPVRVWFETSGVGIAPTVPTGGRNLKVAIATNDSVYTVSAAVAAVLEADAKFAAYQFDFSTVRVTHSVAGSRAPLAGGSAPGFSSTIITAGSDGALVGKTLSLSDANGSVGVWFGLAGTSIPAAAEAKTRALKAVITTTSTAAQVATALQTVLAADSKFSGATVSSTVVTVPDTDGGARTAASAGDTGLPVARKQEGKLVTSTVPYDTSASGLADLLGAGFTVTKPGSFEWHITAADFGSLPSFTASDAGLLCPAYVSGRLDFDTVALEAAFAATTADTLSAVCELKRTRFGQKAELVYQGEVVLTRDLLAIANLTTPLLPTVDSYPGTSTLRRTFHQLTQLSLTQKVVMAPLGDSVAYFKAGNVIPAAKRMYGDAGDALGSMQRTLAGGAVENTTDFASWLNGKSITVPTGGSVVFGVGSVLASRRATKVQIFFLKTNGGAGVNTFKVESSNDNGATWPINHGTTDTHNAGGTIGAVLTYTVAAGSWRTRVTRMAGTVTIIGAALIDESIYGGVVEARIDQPGISLSQMLLTPAAIVTPIISAITPHAIFFEMKEVSGSGPLIATLQSLLDAGFKSDWVFCGTNPTVSTDAEQVEFNAAMRTLAIAGDHMYFDGYNPLGTYARMVEAGMEGDGIHPAGGANEFLAELLRRDLGLFSKTISFLRTIGPYGANVFHILSSLTGSSTRFQLESEVEMYSTIDFVDIAGITYGQILRNPVSHPTYPGKIVITALNGLILPDNTVASSVGVSLSKSANQTITSGTLQKLTWETTDWDDTGTMANLASERVAIPVTGRYLVTIAWHGDSGMEWGMRLYKNGSEICRLAFGAENIGSVTREISCTAADYLEIFAEQYTGASKIIYAVPATQFQVRRVR